MWRGLILTLALALAACGGDRKEGGVCRPLAQTAAQALAEIEATAAADDGVGQFHAEPPFIEVWSAVAGGQANGGSAGAWRMDRMRDGSVVTWRPPLSPLPGGDDAGAAPEDEGLRRAVVARLAEAPLLRGLRLDLRVTRAVVHVDGTVSNAVLGAEAVRVALETPGVRAVVSRLHWPAAAAPPP
ncbi:MAG TPA: BON domain-containing protein [Polyangia bacterium]|nr:BON domain-containing protein [Polyangia bacterium]